MKTGDMATALEWEDDDVPAVIPKRLWDSMLKLQESILAVTDATCRVTKEMIAEVRKGESVDNARLSALDKIVSETLDEAQRQGKAARIAISSGVGAAR
jgi:hypothetical protein